MIELADISFRKVTKDNFEEIISLDSGKEGEKHVASNSYSIIEAFFKYTIDDVKGIYYKKKLVGFVFYYRFNNTIWINRFMIDINYQNKGIGKTALKKLLNKIVRDEKPDKIELVTSNPIMEMLITNKNIGFKKSSSKRAKNYYKKWKEHLYVLKLK